MQKWEYTFRVMRGESSADVCALCDQMGQFGWELMAIAMFTFERHAFFKAKPLGSAICRRSSLAEREAP